VQCRHSYEGAPQRHAGDYEAFTETVEKLGGRGAANSLKYNSTICRSSGPSKLGGRNSIRGWRDASLIRSQQ
jgi:hypothetical protein